MDINICEILNSLKLEKQYPPELIYAIMMKLIQALSNLLSHHFFTNSVLLLQNESF
jgi:hypothetical protein